MTAGPSPPTPVFPIGRPLRWLVALSSRRPALTVTAWLAGTVLSLLFVNYPNIYPGIHAFNQPLIDLLHGADLSGLVSMAVAAGAFAGLVRVASR